jgi:hypothetical protein
MSSTLARLKKVSGSFDSDLTAFLKKYNLKMDTRRTVVRADGEVTLKIISHDMLVKAPDGSTTSPARLTYISQCTFYNLKREWLDKEVRFGNRVYKIVGLNTRKSKNSVLLDAADGGKDAICSPLAIIQRMK